MSCSAIIISRLPNLASRQIDKIISDSDKSDDGKKIRQSVWSVYVEGALHLSDWEKPLLGGDIELRPE